MQATIVINPDYLIDNLQHTQRISGRLTVLPGTGYEVGGIPFDSVVLALPGVTTNSGVHQARMNSLKGTGYIYERVDNGVVGGGTMIVEQVPPAGSLTTASPLQQLGSASNSLSEVANDVIAFEAYVKRNA